MITRRRFAAQAGVAALGVACPTLAARAQQASASSDTLARDFARIEAESGGRLGVAFRDTATGLRAGHRADERFPICSTFKVLAAGAVLTQVDAGAAALSQRIRFGRSDLVPYSPITQGRVDGDGMTLAELCAAAIDYSDNTAGNMLLRQIGGPAGLTRFARSVGDAVTRLDRTETSLNEALPGDPRDTTTPAAMLADLDTLVLGTALSAGSRDQLIAWLRANTTGGARLRAGLPAGYIVGDKTGAGDRGSTNDVAVIWPPNRTPMLLTVYLTGTTAPVDHRNATLAAVARAVSAALRAD